MTRIYLRREKQKLWVASYWSGWPGVPGFENRQSVVVDEATLARWEAAIRAYGDFQREIEDKLREARRVA